MLLAQLVGDGEIASYVTQADRGRQVEHPLRPACRALPVLARPWPRGSGQDVVEHPVECHRFPALGCVAGALEGHQRPAGQLGQPGPVLVGDDPVVGPVHDDHRAAHCRTLLLHRPLAGDAPDLGPDQSAPVRAPPPAHEVLDQLGRVLLGHQLVEEEVEEPGVVTQPGVAVVAAPALVVPGVLPPQLEGGLALGGERPQVADRRCESDPGGHLLGMVRRQVERRQVPHRQPDHHRPLGPGGLEHVQRIPRQLRARVRRPRLRAVGRPVAARVEGDHSRTPGQERHLELPDLGRHDAPGREQQHGRVLGSGQVAVHLPGDAYAVALDVSRDVVLPCLHHVLLRCALDHPDRDGSVVPGRLPARDPVGEVDDGVVHGHRIAGLGQMASTAQHQQLGAGQPCHVHTAGEGLAQVVRAVDDQDRTRDRGQRLRHGRRVVTDELGGHQREHHLAGCLARPLDDVLVDLRAVRVVADL